MIYCVQKSLREIVDVKAFGAVADGVTDDSDAIEEAIETSPIGSAILFSGKSAVSRTVKLLEQRSYVGMHPFISGLVAIQPMVAVAASDRWLRGSATGADKAIEIESLCVDGAGLSDDGILMRSFYSYMNRLNVQNVKENGINFLSSSISGTPISSSAVENEIHNTRISNAKNGIHNDSSAAFTDGSINNCVIYDCEKGVFLERSAGWNLLSNHIYKVSLHGIEAVNCFATRIANNYIDNYSFNGLSDDQASGIFARLSAGRPSTINGNVIHAHQSSASLTNAIHVRSEGGAPRVSISSNSLSGSVNGIKANVGGAGTGLFYDSHTNVFESVSNKYDIQALVTREDDLA